MTNISSDSRGTGQRVRSTIVFPYFALEEAVTIASIVHESYGGKCNLDQLSASLNQKTASGGFRLKVSAARIFGVVATSPDGVSVTDLGSRAIEGKDGKQAKVTAFLHVPLYAALFERFKGRSLPNDKGLEATILDLGVSGKQVTTARQVFQRSADFAGFFTHGRDRLVMPARPRVEMNEAPEESSKVGDYADTHNNDQINIMKEPLILGLLGRLPKPGDDFPQEDRDVWIEALKLNLQLVYGKPKAESQGRANGQKVESESGGSAGRAFKGSDPLD